MVLERGGSGLGSKSDDSVVKKGPKSDDRNVDSVRNQDFFNAGLSPYPHSITC